MGGTDGHDPKALQATVERAASPEMELGFKPMFGGIMGYASGRPFASLSNIGLALKLDAQAQDELLALGGKRLQYEPTDRPSKTYVVVPEQVLNDARLLRTWLERGADFVARSPVPRSQSRKQRQ